MLRPALLPAAGLLPTALVLLAGCAAPRPAAPMPATPRPTAAAFAPEACGAWPGGTVALPQAVRDTLEQRLARGHYVGAAIVLLDSAGSSVHAFGTLARGGAPVTDRTRFEIGSVTKTVTGLLLADAVGRGTVPLDAPLASLLPDSLRLPPEVARITPRHLATHTSGLPRLPPNLFGPGLSPSDPYAAYDAAQLYAYLQSAAPDTAAQRRGAVAYSNLGTGLLGHVLARRAGRSYAALVAGLGLFSEGWTTEDAPQDSVQFFDAEGARPAADVAPLAVATGHTAAGAPTSPWHFTDALIGAGGLRATPAALGAYLAAQLAPQACAKAAAIRRSHTVLAPEEPGSEVAYGWFVRTLPGGRRVFWHNGGTGGFSSFVAFEPARRRGVAVLANTAGGVDDVGALLLR